MKKLLAIALSAISLNASAAVFTGKDVQFQYLYPCQTCNYANSPNGTYTVGAGVEVPTIADGFGNLDITADGFTVNFNVGAQWSGATFNGFRLTDINNTIDDFTSLVLLSNTGLGGTPTLSFDANNLYVNWQGLTFGNGSVNFAVTAGAPNTVPLPAALPLMLSGLGALGFTLRKKKQA